MRGDAAARDWERRSAQAERVHRASKALELRMEREQAHARMPDTLYASTPDPSPPHPFLPRCRRRARACALGGGGRGALGDEASAIGWGCFPRRRAGGGSGGYQGFVRVINRSGEAGAVRIEAWDDGGRARRSGDARHRGARDEALQLRRPGGGQRGQGPVGGASGAGEGDWRLELISALDIEVLGYIRTRDGFLTAMHDMAPSGESGHRVVTFNPGRNVNQVSRLRVVNPGAEAAGGAHRGERRCGGVVGRGGGVCACAGGVAHASMLGSWSPERGKGLSGALGAGGEASGGCG